MAASGGAVICSSRAAPSSAPVILTQQLSPAPASPGLQTSSESAHLGKSPGNLYKGSFQCSLRVFATVSPEELCQANGLAHLRWEGLSAERLRPAPTSCSAGLAWGHGLGCLPVMSELTSPSHQSRPTSFSQGTLQRLGREQYSIPPELLHPVISFFKILTGV